MWFKTWSTLLAMFLICTFLFSLSCPVLWMSETGQSVNCISSMRIFKCVRAFCTHVFVSIPITVWFGPLFHPLSCLIKRELNLSCDLKVYVWNALFCWFCMEELIRAISPSQWGQNIIFLHSNWRFLIKRLNTPLCSWQFYGCVVSLIVALGRYCYAFLLRRFTPLLYVKHGASSQLA